MKDSKGIDKKKAVFEDDLCPCSCHEYGSFPKHHPCNACIGFKPTQGTGGMREKIEAIIVDTPFPNITLIISYYIIFHHLSIVLITIVIYIFIHHFII